MDGREINELITLFEERPYACLYIMKHERKYRNKKHLPWMILQQHSQLLLYYDCSYRYRAFVAVTCFHLSLLGEVRRFL